jgi:hypothetical protein
MANVAYTITPSGILLFINGKQEQVAQDHPNFSKIKELLSKRLYDGIVPLLDARGAVKEWIKSNPRFKLENDLLALDGTPFNDQVTDKVLSMIDAGFNATPLFNFLQKVRLNPSHAAQNELLLFCIANDFMIHEDGDIIAYKSVRENYTDIHSGKFRNMVGDTCKMTRNMVDDNRERTCSNGLHFASHQYASTWTHYGHLMLIKVNPMNVVSIPSDYNNQKGRCCEYVVLGEIEGASKLPKQEVYKNKDFAGFENVTNVYDYDEDDDQLDLFADDGCGADCDCNHNSNQPSDLDKLTEQFKNLWMAYSRAKMNHRPRAGLRGELETVATEIDNLCVTYGINVPEDIEDFVDEILL